ncbi:MAG TPA: hypothetical protein VGL66_07365 [Caulobacteraceae bacterium]|jgi:hypothetical protein
MRATIAAVMMLALAGCAQHRTPDMASEAFKDICVDTHAAPDAVAKAAEAAGGIKTNAVGKADPSTPARFWNLKLTNGTPLMISQVVTKPAAGERDEACGVIVTGPDAASVKEVRTWIGDKADPPYEFRDLDARLAVTTSAEREAAMREDKLWMLTVIDEGSAADFNISHKRQDR